MRLYLIRHSQTAEFRRRKKRVRRRALGAAQLGGSLVVGRVALQSGLPRTLGVRLERHTTTKKNWDAIRRSGSYLDPSKGGNKTGASASAAGSYGAASENFVSRSKGFVHVTGRNTGSPIANVAYRKLQTRLYGGVMRSGGGKPKTIYVPGSDEYFAKNFEIDPDDIALRTRQKVRVYGNRYSATAAQLKKEGLGKSLGQNKGRVLARTAILGAGGYGAYKLGRAAVGNLAGNPNRRRKRRPYRRRKPRRV